MRGRRHIVQLFLFSIDYDLKSFSLSDLILTKNAQTRSILIDV